MDKERRSGRWMLYGANGYTGALIAKLAAERGERPILAGRRRPAVAALAERLGLDHRVFDLSDARALARQLEDVDALLLAAGPLLADERQRGRGLPPGAHPLPRHHRRGRCL
ncbi:MAG: NAD(P)H-binding protein [Nannocystaceae bacterium]